MNTNTRSLMAPSSSKQNNSSTNQYYQYQPIPPPPPQQNLSKSSKTVSFPEPNQQQQLEDNLYPLPDPFIDAILLYEDFWVRTKTPLTYNILMSHEMKEENNSTPPEPITAVATPIKCYMTRANNQQNQKDNGPEDESYLHCLSVCNQECLFQRFSLLMTKLNQNRKTKIQIKFFRDTGSQNSQSSQPFAECVVPVLAPGSLSNPNAVIGSKTPILSVRRKIRIGSLKYRVVFGKDAELLKDYAKNWITQSRDKEEQEMRIGGGGPPPGEEEDDPRFMLHKEPEMEEMFLSTEDINKGLRPRPQQEYLLGNNNEEDKTNNNQYPALPRPIKSNRKDINVINHGGENKQNHEVADIVLPETPTSDKKYWTKLHKELQDKVSELAGKVSGYATKLVRTEQEMCELREEIQSLHSERTRHLQIINSLCEKIDLLKSSSTPKEKEKEEPARQVVPEFVTDSNGNAIQGLVVVKDVNNVIVNKDKGEEYKKQVLSLQEEVAHLTQLVKEHERVRQIVGAIVSQGKSKNNNKGPDSSSSISTEVLERIETLLLKDKKNNKNELPPTSSPSSTSSSSDEDGDTYEIEDVMKAKKNDNDTDAEGEDLEKDKDSNIKGPSNSEKKRKK